MKATTATGVSQIRAARRARSSNTCSRDVPRIRKLRRLSRRELSLCGRGNCTNASQEIVRSGAPGRLTLIPNSSSTVHEHANGHSMRAGRRDDDRLATVPIFRAPPCHSNLRIQAAFVVTFPDSDWTIITRMVSLLLATISTHPNRCQDRPYRTFSWTRCCGFRRCPERRHRETRSDPKSQSIGCREYAGAGTGLRFRSFLRSVSRPASQFT